MKFKDFLVTGGVIENLTATTKPGVIAEILDHLIKIGGLASEMRNTVLNKLLEREAIGTTGIGQQIAVPHARHTSIKKLVGVLARSKAGIDFDSIDGEPVHLFVLLLSSQEGIAQHLDALNFLSQALGGDEVFRRFLINARDAAEMNDLLSDIDIRIGSSR